MRLSCLMLKESTGGAVALIFVVAVMFLGGLVGMGIFVLMGGGRSEPEPDPNRTPGPLKSTLLAMKESLRKDESNPIFCSSCNSYMLRLYAGDKPTNDYQCQHCQRTVSITAR